MIYFSEIQGRKVVTEDRVEVGRLEDIIFLVSESPTITKIVVRGVLKEKLIIPVSFLKKLNDSILIGKDYIVVQLEENELFLLKNLLDKQIIDLKGSKVVRVNDVAIQDKGGLYIAGVDIGLLGILRGLRLEQPILSFLSRFGIKLTSQFLSWGDIQPLELVHGEVKLRKRNEKLERIRPEDLADYLERTNISNAQRFLRILDEKKVAQVIGSLNLNYRAELFRNYKPERAAHLLGLIDSDEAIDILLTLSSKKRQLILEALPKEKQKQYLHLLNYSTTQIGQLLTTEYLIVSPEDQVRDVIKKIKTEAAELSAFHTIYVVNKKKQLVGVFNLHELMLQELDTPVYKFMVQNVIVSHITSSAEIALNKMIKYKLAALPVINYEKNIIGIIAISDVVPLFTKKL
ncbi:CBS domain-containing protein [Candidatus Roizmanbacteria bacterium]|nr:CBS domain-containing protein [Candidatus Roizmanbacteria bacterium]